MRSTMGKKIWLPMHSRNFGSDKVVLTYVRPPLHVSWGETLHSKHLARFGGKSYGHRDFKRETERKKKTRTRTRKPSLSFDLNLMSTLTWKTEKELKREILNNVDQFHWKKNIKILQRR